MRFAKLKNMMPRTTAPRVASPMGAAVPKMPAMPSNISAAPMVTAPMARATLPSIQSTANTATPIELGDPKRLAKIGTLLRLGRK